MLPEESGPNPIPFKLYFDSTEVVKGEAITWNNLQNGSSNENDPDRRNQPKHNRFACQRNVFRYDQRGDPEPLIKTGTFGGRNPVVWIDTRRGNTYTLTNSD